MRKLLLLLLLSSPYLIGYGQIKWNMDSIAKYLEFKYTAPKEYTQIFEDLHFKTPDYTDEFSRNHHAQWISKDEECIVFLVDDGNSQRIAEGFSPKLDKSKTGIPDRVYSTIALYLRISQIGDGSSSGEIKRKVKDAIKIWPEKKAKEWFDAQYVIEYSDAEKEAIYKEKYHIRKSLYIMKWEKGIILNFLVTEKGYKNIDKYMKRFKKAFWFNE